MAKYTADERLYKTADGRVVKEGNPEAAFLFLTPGKEIDKAEAEELGLVKKRAPAQDKQRSKASDK